MIEKYVYKLSTFNLANKPTPTFKSSVLISQIIAQIKKIMLILTISKSHKFL